MDAVCWLWLSGLICGISYLCLATEKAFAFNVPYHLAIFTLSITGVSTILAVLAINAFSRFTSPRLPADHETAIPLIDSPRSPKLSPTIRESQNASQNKSNAPFTWKRLTLIILLLVAAICWRVEVARMIIQNIQCARKSWTPIVPLVLAFVDVWSGSTKAAASHDKNPVFTNKSSFMRFFPKGPLRYLIPIILMILGIFSTFSAATELRSTYICAQSTPFHSSVPFLQAIAAALDIVILICTGQLLLRAQDPKSTKPGRHAVWIGVTFCITALILVFTGLGLYSAMPEHRQWIKHVPKIFLRDSAKLAAAFAATFICALLLASHMGSRLLLFVLPFVMTYIPTLSLAWTQGFAFSTVSSFAILFGLALTTSALLLYLWMEAARHAQEEQKSPRAFIRVPKRLVLALILLFSFQAYLWISRRRFGGTGHPVSSLIADADAQHQAFKAQASVSRNLHQASANYRLRYGRDPPPRFDKWYRFAKDRNSLIIDDFDSMMDELLPFWALPPEEIRFRTWDIISNPDNWIGGILIRNGSATITRFVAPTHIWMLDGVIDMLQPFVKWLPDMDLAFNMNDEARIAVPNDRLEIYKADGRNRVQIPTREDGDFGPERAKQWIPMLPDPKAWDKTRLREGSLTNTFHQYGAIGCPPHSKALQERHWDLGSLCTSCMTAHSKHLFVRNWTLSADPCHQPDLADLHGTHMSPGAFLGSNELLPIFSQSKAHGYNDLLYPSAWNYNRKVAHDPTAEFPDLPFAEKQPTLIWRGGSSEGVSDNSGAWKGMARQRLVHLFNNATSDDRSLVLLPTSPNSDTYAYEHLPPSALHAQLDIDVHFVERIDRCIARDCDDQLAEFKPQYTHGIPFQAHWRYKYLIDVDGAGFSGRFLPFLRSNSLPFKASLLREWWDPRVTAWAHFVPVDIRLAEIWSLLAYFAGWKDTVGREWRMRPRDEQAAQIARAGKEWANTALRREDMEIYFFRLLLEWGRITDDKRQELGFVRDLFG